MEEGSEQVAMPVAVVVIRSKKTRAQACTVAVAWYPCSINRGWGQECGEQQSPRMAAAAAAAAPTTDVAVHPLIVSRCSRS
jgi:hypothetical protein